MQIAQKHKLDVLDLLIFVLEYSGMQVRLCKIGFPR